MKSAGVHEDGFGRHPSDDVDSPAGFAAWVSRLVEQLDTATPPSAQSSAGTRPVPNGVCPELSDMQQASRFTGSLSETR
jgi:hypothetical protein